MKFDIDALIEEARGFAAGSESARATLMRDLADALESTLAELQQERERVGILDGENYSMRYERDEALSRAEETIDRAIECLEENEDRDEVAIAILTEYSEQKGASDD